MSLFNLAPLLSPTSVAVIGGSDRQGSVGQVVVENLLSGGFGGPVYLVNPRPLSVVGASWSATIADLPEPPELAVVAIPAAAVPQAIADLGAAGAKVAVVLSAGITEANGLRQAMLEAAKPFDLRIVGPNGLGLLVPRAHLNASFARGAPAPGGLALISQSGALVSGVIDWANTRQLGFSGIISVGDMAEVDLGDLIDLFAADPHTDAILLYVEGVTNAAKFMSAARAAARIKPVIALKAGRNAASGKAVRSHTGALAGAYDVHACAFERAGIVQVETLTDLFDAAAVLRAGRSLAGERLAIITNGGGAGILALDAMATGGGVLAELGPQTLERLNAALPAGWPHGDPVDLMGDAPAERYGLALDAVLADAGVDAVLVMNCPTALSKPGDIARGVAAGVVAARGRGVRKPVIACWLGDANQDAAGPILSAAGVPMFGTPDNAARAFGHLLAARRAKANLMAAPAGQDEQVRDRAAARALIQAARADGRTLLNEVEAKALLKAYGVATVPTRLAPTVQEVAGICANLAPPYVVKIVSPQISHKSDVGGVTLDLPNAEAASAAAAAMAARLAQSRPEAVVTGFAVETMVPLRHAHELIVGLAQDATFGPVLMVGAGGTAVEVLNDRALGLPPLDGDLARAMIAKTRISRLLAGYRDEPQADIAGVVATLEALSAIAVDLPDIAELDINPLRVDAYGVLALDARIVITQDTSPPSRLVIQPVPMEWAADLRTRSGLAFHVRPVRPDDTPAVTAFFAQLDTEDLRLRFLSPLRTVDADRLALMTQVDYRRAMTFLALEADGRTVIATAMLASGADPERAEVAVTVRSDLKGHGLGWTLLDHVLAYARARGVKVVHSLESADHVAALQLERDMGFTARICPDDTSLRIVERRIDAADIVGNSEGRGNEPGWAAPS
ncbi:bifunctional acetyl coenzyme A synthetase (ADP forming), alpha domain/GNAT family N-acetyltransferase [Caulobacter sp. BK020]|uniref:bifunctional acetate--CoA ligase family protein/GNAT family N-acetyltransferase n=1 Tax=Caulobacter sp. BK020 TaxID=2512117 RepID=UPI0010F3EF50|nr:bifunctional acetyl coenzyme A synthetase (ADP forming), alpha domain/GNAT family N-acetyltransferase [Caulobacter sp. BK020]TCS03918.1 acetyltransferase [Caulobacter sp. BK020]